MTPKSISQPVSGFDRPLDLDLDLVAVPVDTRALMPLGDARQAVGRLEPVLLHQLDVHDAEYTAYLLKSMEAQGFSGRAKR